MSKNKQKKKRFHIILIILAVLAVIGTGCFLYLTPDQVAKAQFKEEAAVLAQEITDKRLSQLSAVTAAVISGDDEFEVSGDGETGSGEEEGDAQTGSEGNPSASQNTEVLQAKLISVYDQIMADMQDDGMALVDKLIDQAKADYKQLKAEKKNNPAAISKLATEYMSKGNALEEQMDNSFYSVTQAMEEQMNSLGIDPNPIISEYQNQYTQIKEQRQKSLIDKALKAVK